MRHESRTSAHSLRAIPCMSLSLLLLPYLCGCASAYERLSRTGGRPEFSTRYDPGPGAHRTTVLVPGPGHRPEARLAVTEAGDGRAERVLVFVHGVMSDARFWRFLGPKLAPDHDLIMIDLPGSGGSDAPDPRRVGDAAYAPPALAAAALEALRQRLAARSGPPPRVTLVGHSLGAHVILRMFSEPRLRDAYGDVLERVDGMVLFSCMDVAIEKDQPTFAVVRDTPEWAWSVAAVSGLLRGKAADATLEGVADRRRALRCEAKRLNEILADPARRRAAQAMIRAAVPTRNRRPDWRRIRVIEAGYARVDVPCLLVWGGRDDVLPESMGHKLRDQLPSARLCVIEDAMHSIPVEHPAAAAALIRQFAANGPEDTAAASVTYRSAAEVSAPRGIRGVSPTDQPLSGLSVTRGEPTRPTGPAALDGGMPRFER